MANTPPLAVQIAGEHAGELLDAQGLLLTLSSPKAFPPGQPLRLSLLLPEAPLSLEARSLGSKKRPDGRFELRVRLINLRKQARDTLAQVLSIEG